MCIMVLWTCGPVDLWTCGPVDLRTCGLVDMWTCGPVDLWTCGPINTWISGPVDCGPDKSWSIKTSNTLDYQGCKVELLLYLCQVYPPGSAEETK